MGEGRSTIEPMTDEISKKLQKLIDFIDQAALTVPDTTTFRQFHDLVRAKQDELGIDWAKLREEMDQDTFIHWNNMVGLAMEGKEIDEHLLDLPLGFRSMPEYEGVLAAEQEFWDNNPDATEEQLREVVEAHMPKTGD